MVVIISASSRKPPKGVGQGVGGKVVEDQVLSADRRKRSTDLKDVEKRSIDSFKRKIALKDVLLHKN